MSSEHTGLPVKILDLADVDSEKWKEYAVQKAAPASWLYALEGRRLASYEDAVVAHFDASSLVTESEAAILRKRMPESNSIHVIGNGVDLEYFQPQAHPASTAETENEYLVFCGLMDYFPNVDAVIWFSREALPIIRQEEPAIRFRIVGARPTRAVMELNTLPGVEVVGRVDDVRPFVQKAAVSVAPLRVARGVQNKVLEAMALAKPVVATPQACEGIPAEPEKDILVADNPRDFAQAVLHLLRDEQLRREIATRARDYVERNHSWEKNLDRLHAMLQSGIPSPEPRSS
jgi:sugar transferase (PEP-CTERM/EpsH1 system associated)